LIRIAITDACIFIDLCDVALVPPFFSLPLEVHTSQDVFSELYPEQQSMLLPIQESGRLTVHNISGAERLAIQYASYPKSLSEVDKTVLHLARGLEAMVLSSDGVVRAFAKRQSIECHGMLWVLDRLLEEALLTHSLAMEKLQALCKQNMVYRNNLVLLKEIDARLKRWGASDI
jgi:hypothetical protein